MRLGFVIVMDEGVGVKAVTTATNLKFERHSNTSMNTTIIVVVRVVVVVVVVMDAM